MDGSEIFYRLGDRMMAVLVSTTEGFEAGDPMQLFDGHYATDDISGNQYYDVDPVTGRFLMLKQEDETAPKQFNVVLHWFAELERRVPTTISR